jgi:branched-chain amino acid transport system ATP-binding protein
MPIRDATTTDGPEPQSALELRDVSAGYGTNVVLRDVSLSVTKGSVVAVVGANGAGKTTLMRSAAGLLALRAGSVVTNGVDVTRLPPHRRARAGVCLIPEGRGIFPSLSVRDNFDLLLPKEGRADAIGRVLDEFPALRTKMSRLAGTMSGGEQQMLAIARAYAGSPNIVMVDEASLGLAPVVVDQIFDFLRRIAESGVTLLLVEQYVSRALAIADQVHIMDRGKIVYSAAAHDLHGREASIFEQYLGIGTVPDLRNSNSNARLEPS